MEIIIMSGDFNGIEPADFFYSASILFIGWYLIRKLTRIVDIYVCLKCIYNVV